MEIMVAMVLTAGLVLGVTGLWASVGDQFFRLTLRQKAVFALHGFMEKVSKEYRKSGGLVNDNASPPGSLATLSTYGVNTTYPNNLAQVRYILIPSNTFTIRPMETVLANLDMGEIFRTGGASFSASDRNVVWLDQGRRITAQISWTLDDIGATPVNDCFGGVRCQLLTLYLDYPYRFPSGSATPLEVVDGVSVETVTVQTIVGRRR